jgi:acyl-CoA synthetase (AMP-forming)/AMP-acid ligase II
MSDHDDFEALAAGYALHALEPEDEQRLAAHLLTCQDCARLVADAAAVGAAFAGLVGEDAAPSAGLRARILAAAAAEPREPRARSKSSREQPAVPDPFRAPTSGARVLSHDRAVKARRLQVRSRIAVGALAAVIGVGVAVPVTLSVSGSSNGVSSQFADALLQPGTHEVSLTGNAGNTAAAKAAVTDDAVYLRADRLPKNNTSDSIYVVWMSGSTGAPAAVATFDVKSGSPVTQKISKLPMKTSLIKHIAISRESGRKAPASPTDILIKGTAA